MRSVCALPCRLPSAPLKDEIPQTAYDLDAVMHSNTLHLSKPSIGVQVLSQSCPQEARRRSGLSGSFQELSQINLFPPDQGGWGHGQGNCDAGCVRVVQV